MNKKVCCTCEVVVLLIKPIVFLTFSLSSASLDLKVPINGKKRHRVFSLTWPASLQIYWNKGKRLHRERVQLPQDWFGTPTWLPFHCLGTQLWPSDVM